jgi:hypothetical protein
MRACASLLSLGLLLCSCAKPEGDFGFRILSADLRPGVQAIHTRLNQELVLSREASEALQHGVALTVTLELELRDATNLTLLAEEQRSYVIRYMPLSEHYQLSSPEPEQVRTFPRLRHVLAALGNVEFEFATGALAPGQYEFRTRTRLENGAMPAPMRLPAMLSAQWRHRSEWLIWPIVISA